MTEPELFAAHRDGTGCFVERCACGDEIHAEKGTEEAVGRAIRLHQLTPVHEQWRMWQIAVEALKRPTRHRCPCKEHGEVA